jgi:hypothetical protein
MTENQRPYNPIISITGDTFKEGQAPIEKTIIDLTKESDASLEDLTGIYPEAAYEILWRALYSSDN